jgi:DNA-directed RNA polymerase subunit RPC12/RpoP
MSDKNKKSTSNVISIAKCSICGKMFKISLTPDEIKAFEKSEDAELICFECGNKIFKLKNNK